MHFISEDLEHYIERHSDEVPEILQQLERETWQKIINPRMLSGAIQGRFLSMMSKMMQPQLVVEIGTYTGYSALSMLEGLAATGVLLTIDINDELDAIHQKYLLQHPRSHQIQRLFGDAIDILPTIEGPIDLVFLDADKSNYLRYYDLLIPRMRSGGMLLIDNVLWSGKVVEPLKVGDIDTAAMVALNSTVQEDTRVDNVMLSMRDGLMMVRKK
jgi:caffeoyl-CoA O-methyltransferase